ncbi:hypothetical protein IMZ48_44660 [Candidatus Bathyarchaeota archaeon]|nr:hypothetical protein [Candidatus Bathyarchaeota archaeon]
MRNLISGPRGGPSARFSSGLRGGFEHGHGGSEGGGPPQQRRSSPSPLDESPFPAPKANSPRVEPVPLPPADTPTTLVSTAEETAAEEARVRNVRNLFSGRPSARFSSGPRGGVQRRHGGSKGGSRGGDPPRQPRRSSPSPFSEFHFPAPKAQTPPIRPIPLPPAETPTILVSTAEETADLVETIRALPYRNTPALYIDLEGIELSRAGSISLVTVYILPLHRAYLVDVHTLQSAAFDTAAPDGTTLRSILEAPTVTKVIFDVRCDSDALYAHYGVKLRGIEDVQLMENATRKPWYRRHVNGLGKCIKNDSGATPEVLDAWAEAKQRGLALFAPDKGGSYDMFNARPLDAGLVGYCVNDVVLLPVLRAKYRARLDYKWQMRVLEETEKRVVASQAVTYDALADGKQYSPWNEMGEKGRGEKARRVYGRESGWKGGETAGKEKEKSS